MSSPDSLAGIVAGAEVASTRQTGDGFFKRRTKLQRLAKEEGPMNVSETSHAKHDSVTYILFRPFGNFYEHVIPELGRVFGILIAQKERRSLNLFAAT